MKKIIKKIIKKFIPQNVINYKRQIRYQKLMRFEILKYPVVRKLDDCVKYEEDFQGIVKKYKKIIIYQFPARHIGEMCLTIYLYMLERENSDKNLHVFFPIYTINDGYDIPNKFLFSKFQEKIICIMPNNIGFWQYCIEKHAAKIVMSPQYDWESMKDRSMKFGNAVFRKDKVISFSLDEINLAINEKREMGIKGKYICFYARDNSYYKNILKDSEENVVNEFRNSDINNCLLMTKRFFKKNIQSVRMGYIVEKEIEADGVIDYATKYRSEFMDISLLADCAFFVCSGSGIQLIATLFCVPQVMINFSVITFSGEMVTPCSSQKDLMIIKKYWDENDKRYLTFREILAMEEKWKGYDLFEKYHKKGIVSIENTPEEISDLAEEMLKKLNGEMVYSEEDKLLQKKYREILQESIARSGNLYYNARMGSAFLRKNKWLLE
jgi:putative glycosyltransferase (TIGR04372 family)